MNSGRRRIRHPATGVSARFAHSLLQEVAAIGVDTPTLLRGLALPFTPEDLASGRVSLLPNHQFVLLHGACITRLAEQANRERDLPPMSKGEVDMLCYCVISCENLAEVIERARSFCAMLDHRAADLSLELQGTEAVFHMTTRRLRHSASGLLTDLSGLSFYHRLFGWLIGESLPVRGYGVYAEALVDAGTLEGFYQQPIRFGCEDNRFAFPARLLGKPVVRSYRSLLERLSLFAFDQVGELQAGGSLVEAVAQILAARLARAQGLPSVAQLASLFNLSRATFQRRLAQEGSGLAHIRQTVRLQLARELLLPAAGLKLGEVAERLGFSDVRAFRRAFLAWTQLTPDAWRRGQA